VFETQVARFNAALASIVPETNNKTRFMLAVSGGPDSLALLLLSQAAFPKRIIAATVDHGLRPDAKQEAEFVAALCVERDIPHAILRPSQPITGNIQSAARAARYALLQDYAGAQNAPWIMTAHHGDDQLETLLMRIIRGSGVDGLASIRARNENIIRPLLCFSKAELEAVCESQGVSPIRDPSNDNADFDRVRLRQWLADSAHPFSLEAANRSTSAMAQASEAISWATDQLSNERITPTNTGLSLNPQGLPRAFQRRLLLHILHMLSPDYIARGDAIERCLDSLIAGKTVTIGTLLCQGDKVWDFSPAPTRRNG
jgi:tRNA(Ile)-lysidine synthase